MSASSRTLEVALPTQLESTEAQGTPAAEPARPGPIEHAVADQNLYLIGRPTLKKFLRYVQRHAVNPTAQGTLADQWQAAKEVVRSLEREEAGRPERSGRPALPYAGIRAQRPILAGEDAVIDPTYFAWLSLTSIT